MNFTEIAKNRQSCRNFDPAREVEEEKLQAILETARISPSATNSQPYHITVCRGEAAEAVTKACQRMGFNKFASDAKVMIVLSEEPRKKVSAADAILKHSDFRSIDIGILSAFICSEATAQGLGSCILGWLDCDKIVDICQVKGDVRLVIAIGYAKADDKLRVKKRKDMDDLVTQLY